MKRTALAACVVVVLGAEPGPVTSTFGEWTGHVETGVMAIGAETTGTRLRTDAAGFDLSATGAIAARLQERSGQQVTVRGRLRVRPGVEIAERRIVTVTEITRPLPSVQRPGGDPIYLAFWWRAVDGRIGAKIAALPTAVRTDLEARLARRSTEADAFVESPEAALARMRADLEAALVAYNPAAVREAAQYVEIATLSHEWEGLPEAPLAEATFAASYLEKHQDSGLRQYLELFQLHRLRAAFEAGEFSTVFPPRHLGPQEVSAFSITARDAAARYRALSARVQQSSDPVSRALAADIDAELYVYLDVDAHPNGSPPGRLGGSAAPAASMTGSTGILRK
jgi:hypothetical protein